MIRTDHARRPAPGNRSGTTGPNRPRRVAARNPRCKASEAGGTTSVVRGPTIQRAFGPAGSGSRDRQRQCREPGFGLSGSGLDPMRCLPTRTSDTRRLELLSIEQSAGRGLRRRLRCTESASTELLRQRARPTTSSFAACRQRGSASRATSIGSRLGATRRSEGRQRQEGNGRRDAVRLSTRGMLRRV
jgi:hypothetical protein